MPLEVGVVQVKKVDEESGVPCAAGAYEPGGKGWGILVSLYGEIRCIVGDDHSIVGGKYILYKTKPHKFYLKSVYFSHKYTEIYYCTRPSLTQSRS